VARRVELSRRAQRDLRSLDAATARRVAAILSDLARDPTPANLDAKPLTGRPPWRRARVGDFRVLYRRLTSGELRGRGETAGVLIERILDRKDLERAIKRL
jgi:mRNA-degrading endonuclease RelE of RelBE toxin-antitoxin system